jgi:hypothetical protein
MRTITPTDLITSHLFWLSVYKEHAYMSKFQSTYNNVSFPSALEHFKLPCSGIWITLTADEFYCWPEGVDFSAYM